MLEQELELQYLDDQHSRAYHSGFIDGLGNALFILSPKKAKRTPISVVWFDEDMQAPQPKLQRIKERQRERSFELQHAGLFNGIEAE